MQRKQPIVWRILKAWTRRCPGMTMVVTHGGEYNGTWIRPRILDRHPIWEYMWVNTVTGRVIDHYSYIPKTANIRPSCRPVPDCLKKEQDAN